MINNKRVIKSFKKLVRIDSLSLKEGKVIAYLKKELNSLGIKTMQAGKPDGGEAGNLLATIPGRNCQGPRLLLNAHVDTVSPGIGVKPVERKGYIYSDGKTVLGADNKAGVAAILEVLKVLHEKRLNHPPLQIIFTVCEEMGLFGSRSLPKQSIKADFGIVMDGGTINKIILQAPSQINLIAKVHGKAAHAGIRPEEGVSAIKAASEAVTKMKLGRIDFETTANIGIIQGGTATNIVPDEVELQGEARSHQVYKLNKQIKHMEQVLKKTCAKHNATTSIKTTHMYKAFQIDPCKKIVVMAQKAVAKAGFEPLLDRTGGGSDANIFNALGIPSIIMGVGAHNIHSTAEQIAILDLINGTKILFELIKEANKHA
ncbi:MAG: M20/M25/M40 family metallo-hydrolase [Candidatus Margulisiibacteriota bacterium]